MISTGNTVGDSSTIRVIDLSTQHELMEIPVYTEKIYSLIVKDSHHAFKLQVEGELKMEIILQDALGRTFPNDLVNVSILVHSHASHVILRLIIVIIQFF